MTPERRAQQEAWVAATLEGLGPRPETRFVHVRAGDDPHRLSFEQFVYVMLTETPDQLILEQWQWPISDPGFTVA